MKKTPWEHGFCDHHAVFLEHCSKGWSVNIRIDKVVESGLYPCSPIQGTCSFNSDIPLLLWTKNSQLSPPPPQGFFVKTPISPRYLSGHRVGVKKGGPWVPRGNRGWGNRGVVRSAKFLWLRATRPILTNHLSISVSMSQVTSFKEPKPSEQPPFPGTQGKAEDIGKPHQPSQLIGCGEGQSEVRPMSKRWNGTRTSLAQPSSFSKSFPKALITNSWISPMQSLAIPSSALFF